MNDGYGEIKFRAQHGEGLALDKVKAGTRQITLRLRDKFHANLESILVEHGLLDAAENLEIAFMAHTRGLGYALQELNRVRGISGSSDRIALMVTAYVKWDDECKKKHFSPKMCRRVILEGHSLTDIDAEYHFRRHTARKNMIDCLAVFSAMLK